MTRRLTNAFMLLCIGVVLWSSSAIAQTPSGLEVRVRYDVFLGGFFTATIVVDSALNGTKYEITSTIETHGIVRILTGFQSRAHSNGTRTENGFKPTIYQARNLWGGGERSVRNDYAADGSVENHAIPSNIEDGRDPVPNSRMMNTTDPLSAALAVMFGYANTGTCSHETRIFDGRRLFDIRLTANKADTVDGPFYKGPAERCLMRRDRLIGFSTDPWLPRSKSPPVIEIWFARLSDRLPPLPVHAAADTGIGIGQIHLKEFQIK